MLVQAGRGRLVMAFSTVAAVQSSRSRRISGQARFQEPPGRGQTGIFLQAGRKVGFLLKTIPIFGDLPFSSLDGSS